MFDCTNWMHLSPCVMGQNLILRIQYIATSHKMSSNSDEVLTLLHICRNPCLILNLATLKSSQQTHISRMGVEWHTWGVENPPAVPEDWLCNTSTSVSTWINYSVWTLKGWCCGVREYSSWPYEWVNKLVMHAAYCNMLTLVHEIPSQFLMAMMLQVLQPPMALCQDER